MSLSLTPMSMSEEEGLMWCHLFATRALNEKRRRLGFEAKISLPSFPASCLSLSHPASDISGGHSPAYEQHPRAEHQTVTLSMELAA